MWKRLALSLTLTLAPSLASACVIPNLRALMDQEPTDQSVELVITQEMHVLRLNLRLFLCIFSIIQPDNI